MKKNESAACLKATEILEVHHPSIKTFIEELNKDVDLKQQAIDLFYLVRDRFLYDPYHLDLRPSQLKSSVILTKNRAWCVEKAIVLATAFRAIGIPSKLGYGIVINHIGVEKLVEKLGREEIVFHGYVLAYINGKWVKTTPAFDARTCRLIGVEPLEWNGEDDAMLQAYRGTDKLMEYVHFYGDFEDVPVQLMNDEMEKYYPHLFQNEYADKKFSFYHLKSK